MISTTNRSARANPLAPEIFDPSIGSAAERGAADASFRAKGRRAGFTLIEIMLVLAILVAMGAIAWPSFTRAYESSKLKSAADKLMSVLGKARTQAMTSGQTQVFKFQLNSGAYIVEQLPDDAATLDANATSDTSMAPTSASSSASSGESPGCKLPEGYVFSNGNRVLDDRTAAAESAITSSNFDTSSPPVLFYSDGTSSQAELTIANQNGRSITITLRSLTGTAHMGEVTTAAAPGATQ